MADTETNEIRAGLAAIVEELGGLPDHGKVEFWEHLAGKLSRIAGRDKPWTWRYPMQVHAGQVEPSAQFGRAVWALGAALDEVPPALAYTVQVRVYARPDQVDDGALIIGASKPCARPGCKVLMVPNVPWRKYCSDECRALAEKEIK